MRTPLQSMYSRLKLSPNPITRKWTLLEPFIFYRWVKWSNDFIEIPAWFEFDGASLPRVFWFIWHPMWIDTLIAALVHDWLYKQQKLPRERCDELFNEVMLITEVKNTKRIIYYTWVRLWGWIAYNNHTKALQNLNK